MNVSHCLSYPWDPGFMIARWENECISLSALSVGPGFMIAQWENECISLFVLSVGPRIHDSSVGE